MDTFDVNWYCLHKLGFDFFFSISMRNVLFFNFAIGDPSD